VLEVVSGFAKRYPDYTYDVKHVYVDGPFVTLHSHATIDKKHRGNPQKGLNIMDIWKVENGVWRSQRQPLKLLLDRRPYSDCVEYMDDRHRFA
ncbi:MAG: nuclear transport factor 2 family protein, partial [Bacteroidota bacterium]